jgi:hypothetical protein
MIEIEGMRCPKAEHCFFAAGKKTQRCARCDWTRAELEAAEADDKLFEGWQNRIEPYVVERLLGTHSERNPLAPLVQHVARIAVRTALEHLDEIGFCSFDWHRTMANDYGRDGKCMSCEHPPEAHEMVSVCPRRYDPPPPKPADDCSGASTK